MKQTSMPQQYMYCSTNIVVAIFVSRELLTNMNIMVFSKFIGLLVTENRIFVAFYTILFIN